jgi:hypothetical protein
MQVCEVNQSHCVPNRSLVKGFTEKAHFTIIFARSAKLLRSDDIVIDPRAPFSSGYSGNPFILTMSARAPLTSSSSIYTGVEFSDSDFASSLNGKNEPFRF